MIFHRIEKRYDVTASEGEVELLKIRVLALGLWLLAVIILVALTIWAYSLNLGDGAKGILTIATSVTSSGGVALILGERSGAKDAGAKIK